MQNIIITNTKGNTVNNPKKSGFFKEQNAGFSAQIYRVTLTKPGFVKKACYFTINTQAK